MPHEETGSCPARKVKVRPRRARSARGGNEREGDGRGSATRFRPRRGSRRAAIRTPPPRTAPPRCAPRARQRRNAGGPTARCRGARTGRSEAGARAARTDTRADGHRERRGRVHSAHRRGISRSARARPRQSDRPARQHVGSSQSRVQQHPQCRRARPAALLHDRCRGLSRASRRSAENDRASDSRKAADQTRADAALRTKDNSPRVSRQSVRADGIGRSRARAARGRFPKITRFETIAALATAPGRGAIAVVRVSGDDVRTIAARVFRSKRPLRPRTATLGEVLDARGEPLDQAVAVFFPAPHSYTGEDVLELQVHGSPVIVRETLATLSAAGARAATPGEFTRRAFLNGKLDLSAAEAVADLVDAESKSAARAARARLAGGLLAAVSSQRERLARILEELSGTLDFPDEVPDPPPQRLRDEIAAIDAALDALERTWEVGRMVREGVGVAIVGPPNAGKSSLLNALLREDRALVSEIPGTTRDTIEESLALGGMRVRLIDTAGIREHADRLESAGIARSERALDAARVALVVVDGSVPL